MCPYAGPARYGAGPACRIGALPVIVPPFVVPPWCPCLARAGSRYGLGSRAPWCPCLSRAPACRAGPVLARAGRPRAVPYLPRAGPVPAPCLVPRARAPVPAPCGARAPVRCRRYRVPWCPVWCRAVPPCPCGAVPPRAGPVVPGSAGPVPRAPVCRARGAPCRAVPVCAPVVPRAGRYPAPWCPRVPVVPAGPYRLACQTIAGRIRYARAPHLTCGFTLSSQVTAPPNSGPFAGPQPTIWNSLIPEGVSPAGSPTAVGYNNHGDFHNFPDVASRKPGGLGHPNTGGLAGHDCHTAVGYKLPANSGNSAGRRKVAGAAQQAG